MQEPSTQNSLTIKAWAEQDRPREKLETKGKDALSDAELIAILIGSGTVSMTAVEVARNILASVDYNLHELAKLDIKSLEKFKGIGKAKAITIVSALELGRRRKTQEPAKKQIISSSADVYDLLTPHLLDLPHEEFWVLLLNNANVVIKKERLSIGGVTATVVDAKLLFKMALQELASAIILVHNHPSGSLKPSSADEMLTQKLKSAGEMLDIRLLDHVIFTNQGYFSFADENIL